MERKVGVRAPTLRLDPMLLLRLTALLAHGLGFRACQPALDSERVGANSSNAKWFSCVECHALLAIRGRMGLL